MKKFFTITLTVLSLMVFVSCGSSSKDNGDTDTSDTADTADTADTGDTDSVDTGDSAGDSTADSGDSTGDSTADSGDSTGDSGDSAGDSGDSAADTGDSDADTDSDTDSDTQIECTGISLDAETFYAYNSTSYRGLVADGILGDASVDDMVVLGFFNGIANASYDLSALGNDNYSTCTECMLIF